jgi:mannose-6-phosphate isomerase-like protein (cupin superfamily)
LQIVTLADQPWYEAEDRAVAREIASPRNSKLKSMSIAEIKIPAGVEVVPHHHVMEEVYYIVAGEGTMMVEDEEAIVKAGQSVVIAPHQWHNIRNHTDTELRLIVTCVPAWAPEFLEFDRSTIPEVE